VRYRLQIDEGGNADIAASSNPNQRFLSPTAIALNLDSVADVVHPESGKLKRDDFGHHP
jgi:hypothetical protein